VAAVKILRWRAAAQAARRQPELLHEECVRIGPRHAAHAVHEKAHVGPREQRLDSVHVEDLVQQRYVVLAGVDHLHAEGGAAHCEAARARLRQVDLGQLARAVRGDLAGEFVHGVGELLERRPAVVTVVLDAEVVLGAARVV